MPALTLTALFFLLPGLLPFLLALALALACLLEPPVRLLTGQDGAAPPLGGGHRAWRVHAPAFDRVRAAAAADVVRAEPAQ